MPKKKKIAQPVTDTTIKPEPAEAEKPPVEHEETKVEVVEPPVQEQPQLTPLQRIDQLETVVSQLLDRLTPVIQYSDQLAQQQQAAQQNAPTQAAPQQSLNMGSILQLLPSLLGGGGGDDEFKKMAINSMQEEIEFSRTFRKLFLSKFAGESLSTMVKATTE